MTLVAQPVTGQDINLAARAARQALDVVLAEQGTSFPPLAAMNAIVSRGATLEASAIAAMLGNALDVDAETIRTILHGLEARGLVHRTTSTADGRSHFVLTDDGVAEHQRLSAITATLTAKLYRDFDAEDLATTRRVLVTLTERATAHVSSALA